MMSLIGLYRHDSILRLDTCAIGAFSRGGKVHGHVIDHVGVEAVAGVLKIAALIRGEAEFVSKRPGSGLTLTMTQPLEMSCDSEFAG